MRKSILKIFLVAIVFSLCLSGLSAQTDSSNLSSTQFDMTGSPQWAKDLRRAEIVAFGAFPIMYLFTSYSIDLGRMLTDNSAPLNRYRTLGIAAGGSILLSLVDYSIVLIKRKKVEREIRSLPPGTTIIIRRPLNEEEGETLLPVMEIVEDPFEAESP